MGTKNNSGMASVQQRVNRKRLIRQGLACPINFYKSLERVLNENLKGAA